ncbi:hypothetical protein HDU86_005044 [Geranomyces michiganensis]|nr:hypothetical protein HDU86_005044 [Geranomyces michiganensis]
MLLTQLAIALVSAVALSLGVNGTIQVSRNNSWLSPNNVAFGVGIAVQIALIAPLELARLICQILFWQGLLSSGQQLRSLITNWSVIYSNSYRGAEDLRGISPIGAFLMLVYLIEVAVLGAIGTLYRTVEIETLKSQGSIPVFVPIQSTAVTYENAGDALAQASKGFFGFGGLYDSRGTQAFETNSTCASTLDNMSWTGCHTVVASPLVLPSLDANETTLWSAMKWATLAQGDVMRTVSTEITTSVTCGPSDDFAVITDNDTDSGKSQSYLSTNATGELFGATNTMWAAIMPQMRTPQVQIITFGKGSAWEEPPVDDQGRMVFAVHAFNFDEYPGMRRIKFPFEDMSGVRHSAAVLCTAAVATAATTAEYTVLETSPRLNVRLNSAMRKSDPELFSMNPQQNPYGYSMGIFLVAATTIFGCDLFPCSPSDVDPPLFDRTIGLVKTVEPAAGSADRVTYSVDLASLSTNVARLMSRLLLSYTAAPQYPEDLPAGQVAATQAKLYDQRSMQRLYTTNACNIVLAIGIASAALLTIIHLVALIGIGERFSRSAIWTTSSVLFLLQALSSNSEWFPELSQADWQDVDLDILREAAERITVKGNCKEGRVNLQMDSVVNVTGLSARHVKNDTLKRPEVLMTNAAEEGEDA